MAQYSLEIIDSFRNTARQLARVFYQVPMDVNNFRNTYVMDLPIYNFIDSGIQTEFNDHYDLRALITFDNIRPAKIESVSIDDPIVLNERVQSVELKTWTNDSIEPLKESFSWTEKETRTETLDISAEITTSLRGKLSAEYGAIKGELETQLTAKLGVDHNDSKTTEVTKNQTEEFVIPQYTKTSLTDKHSTTDYSQEIRTRCVLDAHVKIEAGWTKEFETLSELQNYLNGSGGGTGQGVSQLDAFFIKRWLQNFKVSRPLVLTTDNRLYTDAKTGEVTRKDTPITH